MAAEGCAFQPCGRDLRVRRRSICISLSLRSGGFASDLSQFDVSLSLSMDVGSGGWGEVKVVIRLLAWSGLENPPNTSHPSSNGRGDGDSGGLRRRRELVVGDGLEVREEVEFGGESAGERLGGEVDGGDPVRGVAFDAVPGAGIGAGPFGGDGGEGGHDGDVKSAECKGRKVGTWELLTLGKSKKVEQVPQGRSSVGSHMVDCIQERKFESWQSHMVDCIQERKFESWQSQCGSYTLNWSLGTGRHGPAKVSGTTPFASKKVEQVWIMGGLVEEGERVKKSPYLDARLADICISTSAAPTYLPAYHFENQDEKGNVREFNLIDGGVAANNPTLVAISEVTKQIFGENPDFFPIKPMDYGRFLVISIGTGSPKVEKRYNAKMAAKWGVLGWLLHGGSTPLVDIFTQASGDMVDFHNSVFFQALHSEDNYLRIQEDTLTGTDASVDVSTKKNLNKLVEISEKLLKKPVSRVNLELGLFEPIKKYGTNEDALKWFAKMLSDERRLRELKSPHTKKGST
ncbi:PATATIN-like protein 4 [Actinidia rufa]|uniref:Patatin n=1 Tax=Actinidia rufa TaxID=165716 RepID=A0A7J0DF66_9ERIC|nr:PATATIN-like protein 4 [Actinidia rufa]